MEMQDLLERFNGSSFKGEEVQGGKKESLQLGSIYRPCLGFSLFLFVKL